MSPVPRSRGKETIANQKHESSCVTLEVKRLTSRLSISDFVNYLLNRDLSEWAQEV